MAELVDASVSKTDDREVVPVRSRLGVPLSEFLNPIIWLSMIGFFCLVWFAQHLPHIYGKESVEERNMGCFHFGPLPNVLLKEHCLQSFFCRDYSNIELNHNVDIQCPAYFQFPKGLNSIFFIGKSLVNSLNFILLKFDTLINNRGNKTDNHLILTHSFLKKKVLKITGFLKAIKLIY